MEQKKIKYYNSLHIDNVTRHGCRNKIEMQEDTLQVLRDYLQNEHMKDKRKDLPNEWKIYYVQGPTTGYDKYYRWWGICMHVLQLHPK
jgi:hypothetical protein